LLYSCTGQSKDFDLDDKLLYQVVTNLLSNAIKYSPEGGMVYIDVACEAEQLTLKVSDEGIGIPAKDQQRLFTAFHRASNVGAIAGTGLGLLIVKHAVDLHGGAIVFQSKEGVGTTFVVTIPRREEKDSTP
jgi:signal transduction histidine kinase